MNRRALKVFVAPAPAVLRFASRGDERARRALIDFIVRLLDRAEAVRP